MQILILNAMNPVLSILKTNKWLKLFDVEDNWSDKLPNIYLFFLWGAESLKIKSELCIDDVLLLLHYSNIKII